jgi:chemotaxis response regulator CheB
LIHLVHYCRNSYQLPEQVEALKPDVLLIDIDTTLDNSLEASGESAGFPGTRIAVLPITAKNHSYRLCRWAPEAIFPRMYGR